MSSARNLDTVVTRSPLERGQGNCTDQASSLQQPDIRAMAGDQVRHLGPARKPSGRHPPVSVNQIGEKPPYGAPDGPPKRQDKAWEPQCSHRRQQGTSVKIAGVGHSLEQLGTVAKATNPQARSSFVLSGAGRMGQ